MWPEYLSLEPIAMGSLRLSMPQRKKRKWIQIRFCQQNITCQFWQHSSSWFILFLHLDLSIAVWYWGPLHTLSFLIDTQQVILFSSREQRRPRSVPLADAAVWSIRQSQQQVAIDISCSSLLEKRLAMLFKIEWSMIGKLGSDQWDNFIITSKLSNEAVLICTKWLPVLSCTDFLA